MTTLTFVEYHNISGKNYDTDEDEGNPSGTFYFIPNPKSIKKDVDVKWRIRRAGYEKKIERARFRYNEKIQLVITGSCNAAKRDEIEFYSKRDSLFKVLSLDMKTYHAEDTEDCEGEGKPWHNNPVEESFFVIIVKVAFTQREAKVDPNNPARGWYDYSLTVKRIHTTRH